MRNNKCCYNCKYCDIKTDDIDVPEGGYRIIFDCKLHWIKQDMPMMCAVLERSNYQQLKLETSFVMTFYCCNYEEADNG